jgi:hypothetical protein
VQVGLRVDERVRGVRLCRHVADDDERHVMPASVIRLIWLSSLHVAEVDASGSAISTRRMLVRQLTSIASITLVSMCFTPSREIRGVSRHLSLMLSGQGCRHHASRREVVV